MSMTIDEIMALPRCGRVTSVAALVDSNVLLDILTNHETGGTLRGP
jgi:hypothetical protein